MSAGQPTRRPERRHPRASSIGRVLLAGLGLVALLLACGAPETPSPGEVHGGPRPAQEIAARGSARRAAGRALGAPEQDTILFGDLHVHTTWSVDAFFYSLPILGGEGAHPPADACDYARWCAGLDFFSINDHAEGLLPALWRETKRSIRECNARAGDPTAPDIVAYLGWEWTQVGATPETHYGHRNVIFEGLADDEVPTRPIASVVRERATASYPPPAVFHAAAGVLRLAGKGRYAEVVDRMGLLAGVKACPSGVPERKLPADCMESVATPAELFAKLDDWAFPAIVIPHGLAWGSHAAADFDMRTQLVRAQLDPSRQRLIEVMSGHGNSEEYRPALDFPRDAKGALMCPKPTRSFLACCWRAGQIARERCKDPKSEACEEQVHRARQLALAAGSEAHRVFPDTKPADWLDCDQCRDCFKPDSTLRPRLSVQYATAISNFDEPDANGRPLRYHFGFIASSDIHNARAGASFKQTPRRGITDQRGSLDPADEALLNRYVLDVAKKPTGPVAVKPSRFRELFDTERYASFLYTGGIVAVHAHGRDRGAIWDALQRRDVYGTSGPRMLLWFDLENGPRGRSPMGSEVVMGETPRFTVRAAGALVQLPGCPQSVVDGLGAARTGSLCLNECYHPGDTRNRIDTIEVVRIRPQAHRGEPIAPLIEDPWLSLACPPDPAGCSVTFEDPDFARAGRDTVYYVRALQEPTPAINGANLRTRFDAAGNPVEVHPCAAGFPTPPDDDCLAPVRERAWSSPIYVDWSGAH